MRVQHPELRAVIQADGSVTHRQVIAALDAIKRAGVTRIAFGALPAEDTLGTEVEAR